jgi:hypothetical protein
LEFPLHNIATTFVVLKPTKLGYETCQLDDICPINLTNHLNLGLIMPHFSNIHLSLCYMQLLDDKCICNPIQQTTIEMKIDSILEFPIYNTIATFILPEPMELGYESCHYLT